MALGSFTAEFGMGSGAFLPAMTTRPAKGKSSWQAVAVQERKIRSLAAGLSSRRIVLVVLSDVHPFGMDRDNESDEADRAISTGKLHALLRFHTRPIDVVVFHGSDREYWF